MADVTVTKVSTSAVFTDHGCLSWRRLRQAARDDMPDPHGIGATYRGVLDAARKMARERGLTAARWEIPGVMRGPLGDVSEAARERLLQAAAAEFPGETWPARDIRVQVLDPDEVALVLLTAARAEEIAQEIARAQGAE